MTETTFNPQTVGDAFRQMGNSAEVAGAGIRLFFAVSEKMDYENEIAFSRQLWPHLTLERYGKAMTMPRYVRRRQGKIRQQNKAEVRKAYRRVVELRREGKGGW